jgi:hypothetical protein
MRSEGKQASASFLEKRSKKLLSVGAWCAQRPGEVFWFFFSKKNFPALFSDRSKISRSERFERQNRLFI